MYWNSYFMIGDYSAKAQYQNNKVTPYCQLPWKAGMSGNGPYKICSLSPSNNRLGYESLQITHMKRLMATNIQQSVFSYFLRPVQRTYWLQQQKLSGKTVFCRQLLKYEWPFPHVTNIKKMWKCCKMDKGIQEKEKMQYDVRDYFYKTAQSGKIFI